jgi:hypothetical protein
MEREQKRKMNWKEDQRAPKADHVNQKLKGNEPFSVTMMKLKEQKRNLNANTKSVVGTFFNLHLYYLTNVIKLFDISR